MSKLVIITNDQRKASRYAADRGIVDYEWVNTQKWNNFVENHELYDLPGYLYPDFVVIPESISTWDIAQITFDTIYSDLFRWIQLCGEITGVRYDHYYIEQYFNDICTLFFDRGALCYEDRNGKWTHVPALLEPLFLLEKGEWILKSIE